MFSEPDLLPMSRFKHNTDLSFILASNVIISQAFLIISIDKKLNKL